MQVLVPISVTDAMLISSTVPEPSTGEVAWNSATAYVLNDEVFLASTHRRYRAVIANTNRNPATDTVFPAAWVDIGPTNRWAMLDNEISTQTIADDSITVVLKPGAFNALSMFGLLGDDVDVVVRDGADGPIVYEYHGSLENSDPPDYWEYFFWPYAQQTDIALSNIPTYVNAEVTITISGGSQVRIGSLLLGDLRTLGCTMYGATARLVDYSYIKVDDFGNNMIVKRKNAKDMVATAVFDTVNANQVVETLAELLAVPCVWIASEAPQYGGLRVYGLGTGEVSYSGPNKSFLNLTVKGLV